MSPSLAADLQSEAEPLPDQLLHPLVKDPKFIVAAAAVLLAVIFYRLSGSSTSTAVRRRKGVPNVLLVGPCDAGKTALFAQLGQHVRIDTHTSAKTSVSLAAVSDSANESDGPNKQIRLVDLPGHPRLQDEVKAHLPEADGVVFMVDVQAVLRNGAAVAETLPPLLTSLASRAIMTNQPVRLLLLASKSDLLIRPTPSTVCPTIPAPTRQTAIDRLQSILTREMDRLKQARASSGGRIEGISSVASSSKGWKRLFGMSASAVQTSDGEVEEDEGLVWGGKGGFRWEDVEGVEISWGANALGPVPKAAGAKGEEGVGEGLKDVREWVYDL